MKKLFSIALLFAFSLGNAQTLITGGAPVPQTGEATVTTVTVSPNAGVTGVVTNATTTPSIAISLGAITPTSVNASGTVAGSNISGTNTGDQTITLTGDVTGAGTGSFATSVKSSVVLPGSPTITVTPTAGDNSNKVVNSAFVTGAIATAVSGVNPAVAVQAATTTTLPAYTYNNGVAGIGAFITITTPAVFIVDSYTFTTIGQRVLIKNEAGGNAPYNGVYYVSVVGTGIISTVLIRALDYDQPSDMNNTGAIPVLNGTDGPTGNKGSSWVQSSQVTTVGTDAVTFAQFSYQPSTLITKGTITDAALPTGAAVVISTTSPSNTTNVPVSAYFLNAVVTQGASVGEIQDVQMRMTGAATGTVIPIVLSVSQENTGGGTITSFPATGTAASGLACNNGAFLQANGTTSGSNVGGIGRASSGAFNIGLLGISTTADANKNIGVYGTGNSTSGFFAGGVFTVGTNTTTLTSSAAIILDNLGSSAYIMRARANAVDKFTIDNAGNCNVITNLNIANGATLTYAGSNYATTNLADVATGTFTPTYTGFSANPTIRAFWTKINNIVTVTLVNDNAGTLSGTSTPAITNLPYTSNSASTFTQTGLAIVKNVTWQNSGGIWLIAAGSTTISFGYNSAAAAGGFTNNASVGMAGVIQYRTD